MTHDPACACSLCRAIRERSHDVTQADRDLLADQWELWIGHRDGEATKLRAGENGACGSPRFVALQAIAATRLFNAPAGSGSRPDATPVPVPANPAPSLAGAASRQPETGNV